MFVSICIYVKMNECVCLFVYIYVKMNACVCLLVYICENESVSVYVC